MQDHAEEIDIGRYRLRGKKVVFHEGKLRFSFCVKESLSFGDDGTEILEGELELWGDIVDGLGDVASSYRRSIVLCTHICFKSQRRNLPAPTSTTVASPN